MELSAVLSLRDKLSAQMNKASNSITAMTDKVNKSKEAIARISATQNINISAQSNIPDIVNAANLSITSLQSTVANKELALQGRLDLDGMESETIQANLAELGSFLDSNAGKVDEYSNKLAILKQKQSEFTDGTKGSTKLGVEQSIESLESKLAEIEAAKQQFAEWQQISIDYNELELARAELSTLETALEDINGTNTAVRAYIDFKNDALKQVYDIDEKVKDLGKRVIQPIIKLKDSATEKIKEIQNRAKGFAREKFAPIINAVDRAKPVIASVRTRLAQIAGTIAYPIIKAKDAATSIVNNVKGRLETLKNKIFTPEVRVVADKAYQTIKDIGAKLGSLTAKAGKAIAGATATVAKGAAIAITTATVAVGGLGAASINVGQQFEASMSQVAATMGMTADEANYSNESYKLLADTAKKMGAETKFSASEAGEALNYLALAGYDAEKATKALPTILDLAAAGGMDLAAASDMITDSMSALGIEATQENLTAFGDKMAVAAQKSNTSVAQLGEAILTVGGTAKNLAGGTTELNTMLGILADSGIKGSEGGTALRNVLLSLTAPTDQAADLMQSLGVNAYDAQGKMRPMNEVLAELSTSMGSMTDADKQNVISTIFNKNDLKSVNALLSGTVAQIDDISAVLTEKHSLYLETDDINNFCNALMQADGELQVTESLIKDFGLTSEEAKEVIKDLNKTVPRFDQLSGYIEDSDDAMKNMATTMGDNLQGRITEFQSAMEGAGIAIYEAIGSGQLKDIVKEASGWIGDLTQATQEGGLDGLAKAFGSIFSKAITKISSMAPDLFSTGINIIDNLLSGLSSNMPGIASGLSETAAVFLKGIIGLMPKLSKTGGQMIIQLAKGIATELPSIVNCGVQAIQEMAQGISGGMPAVSNVIIQIITTLGQGIIDNIPIIAQSGIIILNSLVQGIIDLIPVLLTIGVELILALADGILQMLPTILDTGLQLIMTLVQGLVNAIPNLLDGAIRIIMGLVGFITESIPMLLQAALFIIVTLVQGLVSNIPTIIEGAIQILIGLINGIITNLPMIIQTAIEIVFALIKGLIQAIPEIIAAIPKLISAIIDTILNTNWLEVGWNIVKGIAGGLFNGIKSLFDGGEDAAEEMVNGVESGLNAGITTVESAATNVSDCMSDSMQPDTSMLSEYGFSANESLASGIESGSSLSIGAAQNTALNTTNAFEPVADTSNYGYLMNQNLASGIDSTAGIPISSAENLSQNTIQSLTDISEAGNIGADLSNNLANGIESNTGTAITAANSMSEQVKAAATSDVEVNITANAEGLNTFTEAVEAMVAGATTSLERLPTNAKDTWNQVNNNITTGIQSTNTILLGLVPIINQIMVAINMAFIAGLIIVNATVSSGMNNIVSTVNSVSLYSSGQYIMQGLNNGMLSMRGMLMATARTIATDISKTIDSSLDIHSPSRVTTKSGRFAGEGLIVGMESQRVNVENAALDLSYAVSKPIEMSNKESNDGYKELDISNPVSVSGESYNNTSNTSKIEKHYHIANIIGEVKVTGEGDEDRLVEKIINKLAEEIEETDDNM